MAAANATAVDQQHDDKAAALKPLYLVRRPTGMFLEVNLGPRTQKHPGAHGLESQVMATFGADLGSGRSRSFRNAPRGSHCTPYRLCTTPVAFNQRLKGWIMPKGRRSKHQEDLYQPERSASSTYQLCDLVPFSMVSVGQPALAAEVVQRALHCDPFIIWALGAEQQPHKEDKTLAKPWEEAFSEYLSLAASQRQQQQEQEQAADSQIAPKLAQQPAPKKTASSSSSSRLFKRACTAVEPIVQEVLTEDAALMLYAEL